MTYSPRTASGARALAHLASMGIEPMTGAPLPAPRPLAPAPRRPARPALAPSWPAPRPVPDCYRPRMLARALLALAPRALARGSG